MMLRHPVILAGLVVVALLGITAGILTIVDNRGSQAVPAALANDPTQTPAESVATAQPRDGDARTLRTAAVRTIPGDGMPVLGSLPEGASIALDGRSSEGKWLRIVFPPQSGLYGWVDARLVDARTSVMSLPVRSGEAVVHGPPPPTQVAVQSTGRASIRSSNASPASAPPTSTPGAAPVGVADLIAIGGTVSDGKMTITVKNVGTGTAKGTLVVSVASAAGQPLGSASAPIALKAGEATQVTTSYAVTASQRLIVTVNPGGAIAESNTGNNSLTMAVAISQ